MKGQSIKARASRNNLPAATTRIVGRTESIGLIQKQLRRARLVSIVGAGGIGKTRVALAVAEQAIGKFRDGVWLVDFAPLQESSLAANAIATAIGLAVHSSNILQALCRSLRGREALLVFDNCEHMVEAIAGCAAQILREANEVRIITTSRAALGLTDEYLYRLPGLATPASSVGLTAEKALTFSAIQLFVERATDSLETFSLSDDDASVLADICKRLDGIALAIELAAMRVDELGLGGLQRQLQHRFSALAGRRGGHERHRTLAAMLEWSYGLLLEKEAAMLRVLSAFTGAFRISDAVAVSRGDPSEVSTIVSELTSKSLLSIDVDGAASSYRLLETTRKFCAEKLLAQGEDETVRLEHAEHVCRVLEQASKQWEKLQSRKWAAANGRYLDELRAALSWVAARSSDRPLLVRLTAAGTLLWNHFSLTDESRGHLLRAVSELDKSGFTGTATEIGLQLALAGSLLYTRGAVVEAREAMERALRISMQIDDVNTTLQCLRLIATHQLFSGDHETGIGTLQTFLAVAAAADPAALPEGETHLAVAELFVGRLQDARVRLERLYRNSSPDLKDAGFAKYQYSNSMNILVVLAHAEWLTGSPDAALRTVDLLIAYGSEAQHELSMSIALAFVCLLLLWMGEDEDCRRYVLMLDDLVERHGIYTWRPVVMFCRANLGGSYRDGTTEQIEEIEQALAEFRKIRHMARHPYYVGGLAQALERHGRLQEAEETINDALKCATTQGERWCTPELLRIQASISTARGNSADAEALLRKAIAAAEEIGALPWKLRATCDLARLWQNQSRPADARNILKPVYDAFAEGFGTPDLKIAKALLEAMP